jgi:hypothetical protein
MFHLDCLRNFINSFLSSLQNVEDAIQLLSTGSASSLPENFVQKSFSILVDNSSSLKADQLISISNEALQQFFSSDEFNTLDEDIQFGFIVNLIKNDPNKRTLLKVSNFILLHQTL